VSQGDLNQRAERLCVRQQSTDYAAQCSAVQRSAVQCSAVPLPVSNGTIGGTA
jgi:hypothetical protein